MEASNFVTVKLPDGTEVCEADEFNGRLFPTFPPDFKGHMQRLLSGFQSKPGDILIYGYMKSGTHWLWEITRMLIERDDSVCSARSKMDGFLEMASVDQLHALAEPRILSTHLMESELPCDILASSKVVVPLRHPKAVAVSAYKQHSAEVKGTNLRCGWERFIRDVWFDRKYVLYYTWTEFTSDIWRRCCEQENYHPVVYEQLLQDPDKTIQDLSGFLGLENITPDLIQRIRQATHIDNMRKVKVDTEKLWEETFAPGYTMFRQGSKDGWKEYFTQEQSRLFDERMAEACEADPYLKQAMALFTE